MRLFSPPNCMPTHLTFHSLCCHVKALAVPFGIRCSVRGSSTDISAPSSTTPTTGRSCRAPFNIGTPQHRIFASVRWSGIESPNCYSTWTTAAAAEATVACRTSNRHGSGHPCRIPSNKPRKNSASSLWHVQWRQTWKRPRSNCIRRAPGAIAAATADTVAIAKWHLLPAVSHC